MVDRPEAPRLRRLVDRLLSIGAYPDEPEEQRARRRIVVAAFWLGGSFTLVSIVNDFAGGFFWSAMGNVLTFAALAAVLIVLRVAPQRFPLLLTLGLVVTFVVQLIQTALFGGLVASGAVVLYGLIVVQIALLALGMRAAWWWFAAYIGSVLFAVAVPRWIEPLYTRSDPEADLAFALIGTGVVTVAMMGHFVRQRDRFQRRSDDLLHNTLPESIVRRLKGSPTTIADAFPSASILFADVCDFTPMSAGMTPRELVALLDRVFTTFDEFVDDLGLEKIKTIGDAYMVASGVPEPRPDHAEAIAELALRMRDHAEEGPDGRPLRLRIGINSGPVVAGIIGSHRFAYDLWGDAVNTASRMESTGVPGQIQITAATRELIEDRFVCEPRGPVEVKGKGPMPTFLLLARRV